tara:strand:- start:1429 stop:2733 length:1305 start_codon:yes stop_codon:yes gene_type:complete
MVDVMISRATTWSPDSRTIRVLAFSLAITLFAGCSDSAPSSLPPGEAESVETPTDSGGLSPDESTRITLEGLRQGDAGVLWDSLPNRYQVEINEIIRGFASRMDQDVWKRTFALAERILELMRNKKNLILDNPDMKPKGINMRLVGENWSTVIDLLEGLIQSELSDIQAMRQFDGGEFFPSTGTKALKQLAALSSKDPNDPFRTGFDADIQLISLDGNDATIGLTMGRTFVMTTQQPVDKRGNRVPVVLHRVDGKWIVSELEHGLKLLLEDGRNLLTQIPEDAITSNRKRLIKLLDQLDEDMDRIELAKTRTQFNQALALTIIRLNQLLSEGTEADQSEEPMVSGRTVTVVLVGDLDDARRQTLVDRLIKITAARGKPRVTVDGKTTKVILPTQRFLQDVVDGVDFGKVGDVDEVERTLTVTVSSDSQEGTPED